MKQEQRSRHRVPNKSRGQKQHAWARINQLENQQRLDRWLRMVSRLVQRTA